MTRMPGVFARWSARRGYFAARAEADLARVEFFESGHSGPAVRREVLLWRADCEQTMAVTAFGLRGADEPDQDGYTLAHAHGMAAVLLCMVADTELDPGTPWRHTRRSTLDDDPAIADVLARLADPARYLWDRAVLTQALRDLVVTRVGRRAADVLTDEVAYGYYLLAGMSAMDAWQVTRPDGRWPR